MSYRYPGATVDVLRDLSFELDIGLTVVSGPSGAGKSTLLELLAGLRRASAGVTNPPAAQRTESAELRRASVGVTSHPAKPRADSALIAPHSHLVTQRPFLAPGTVRDNLTLGNDSTDNALWEVLREVGLESTVAGLEQGLDTRLGDDGFGLSAGQRARLTLARAALSTAPLILLDEPTAHLDVESAALAHNLIRKLAGHRIVVAVSHRPELLALADKKITLTLLPASFHEVFS